MWITRLGFLALTLFFFSFFAVRCGDAKQQAIHEAHQEIYDRWWTESNQEGNSMMDMYFGSDGSYLSSGQQDGKWQWTVDSVMKIETPSLSWIIEFERIEKEELIYELKGKNHRFVPRAEQISQADSSDK